MPTKKHVVLLKSNSGHSGGLEKYASRIAAGFVKQDARVSILTTQIPAQLATSSSITFYPIKTSPWPPSLRMEQFDKQVQVWLKSAKADLVFGMDRNRFQTHIRAGNGVHIAYLKSRRLAEGNLKYWLCRINPMHQKILELEKAAFENPSLQKLFANSFLVRDQLLEHYNINQNKIEVIHNGVEWQEMQSSFDAMEEEKPKAIQKFHLNPDVFHFLFIGNGYLRKGLFHLLIALSKIKTKDFQLSVVGKDNQMEFYKSQVHKLGLQNKVLFFGPQEDITPFYQLADSLIIPSFYDPFANVTIEALAMGLSVISSKYNGGHEILNNENGIIIDDLLNTESIVASLELCLKRPKTLQRAQLIRESVAHLDFSKQLKKLIQACG